MAIIHLSNSNTGDKWAEIFSKVDVKYAGGLPSLYP
jgi:hypothetical protein